MAKQKAKGRGREFNEISYKLDVELVKGAAIEVHKQEWNHTEARAWIEKAKPIIEGVHNQHQRDVILEIMKYMRVDERARMARETGLVIPE